MRIRSYFQLFGLRGEGRSPSGSGFITEGMLGYSVLFLLPLEESEIFTRQNSSLQFRRLVHAISQGRQTAYSSLFLAFIQLNLHITVCSTHGVPNYCDDRQN
jgi:hypothetical protein